MTPPSREPLPLSTEALRALYGTWRLARGDRRALGMFTYSTDAFWRSFLASLIVFPAFAFLRLHDLGNAPDGFPTERYMLVEVISYIIKCFAFPLLMFHVAPMIERTNRYIPFMTVYNWSGVLQMAVYLAALFLGLAFPMLGTGGFVMIAVIAMLAYGVYIAMITLSVPMVTASAIIAADFLLSLVVTSFGIRLALGKLF